MSHLRNGAVLGGLLLTAVIAAPRPAFAAVYNSATSIVSISPASVPQGVSAAVVLQARVQVSATAGANTPVTLPAPNGLVVELSYNNVLVQTAAVSGGNGIATFTVDPSTLAGGLAPGAHNLVARVKAGQAAPGANNNYQTSDAETTLTVTTPAQVATATTLAVNPASILWQSAESVVLTATATREDGVTPLPAGLTVTFRVDTNTTVGTATVGANGQAVLTMPPAAVSLLSANDHVFTAAVEPRLVVDNVAKTATHYLGTQTPGTATLRVIADQTAPATTATVGLLDGVGDPVKTNDWYNAPLKVTLSATDASGVQAVRYQVNGGAVVSVPGSGATIPLAADGDYVIKYGAIDAYGNEEMLTDENAKSVRVRIDQTAPSIPSIADVVAEATSMSGAIVGFTAPSVGDGPLGSGVDPASFSFDPAAGIFGFGTTVVTFRAADLAGNAATRAFSVTVQDTTPPVITVPIVAPVEATSPAGAVVNFPAAEATDLEGSLAVTYSHNPGSVFPLGTTTVLVTARDGRGNSAGRSFTVTVQDTIAPSLNPTIVPNRFLLNAPESGISANASDSGSGLASVVRDPLDTATVGTKTMNFTATDNVGNVSRASVNYEVGYGVTALYDQAKVHKAGSTIPVKLKLVDHAGANVSSAGVSVVAQRILKLDGTVEGTPVDSGSANPDFNFRYDATLGGYIYNLSTKGLTTGSYQMAFTAGGDPKVHTVRFEVK